ncbi:unnamed protein product [Prorocentrum cordatum]|uniref:Amino acid transporter transmembrane domain-containing protein n=1 Tax=Prorocentrum cordatum TaxID=2364126 RepID=A0ABN9RTZ1_9DINO|nr:unnamed protein product [Polarella glacialis]|mmetsp:Transcript_24137/g.68794  ORF Transcript_24137/g.68794 Transcript_24137/m.68794 type:complete len:399 (+) Transcript_24137:190-1386(+)
MAPAPRAGSSRSEALWNMLCFTVGAGMLALPHALLFAGSWFWIPLLGAGALSFYMARLLHRVQLHFWRLGKEVRTYESLCEACGMSRDKSWLWWCTGWMLAVNQTGIALLYVLTICKNLDLLLLREGSTGQAEAPSWQWYPLVGLCAAFLISLGPDLAHVSGSSLVGFLSVLLVGVLIVVAPAPGGPSQGGRVQHPEFRTSHCLTGISTSILAYGGHPVFPSVQGNMLDPSGFSGVLETGFLLMVAGFWTVVATSWRVRGYLVEAYILDSLDASLLRTAAVCGLTLHFVAALPVVLLPAAKFIEDSTLAGAHSRSLRVALVCAVVYAAYQFPSFEDIVSLLGSLTSNFLVFMLPLVLHHLTFPSTSYSRTALHALIFLLSLAVLAVGSSAAISNLASG